MCLRHQGPLWGLPRAALAGILVALALPAAAAASHGTVLLVDARQHVVEVVSAQKSVNGYGYTGRISGVGFGSRIRYRTSGGFLRVLGVKRGRATRVSFLARVVASGRNGLILRLSDGTPMALVARALKRSRMPLLPGRTVLVTESSSGGHVHLSLAAAAVSRGGHTGSGSVEPGVGSGSGGINDVLFTPTGAESSGTGATVVELDSDHIVLLLSDGSTLTPLLPPAALSYVNDNSDLNPCEIVSFAYHESPRGPVLDSFTPTGMSALASIAVPADQDTCADENGAGSDAVGTITALSPASITLSVPGVGPLTVSVDPESGVTDGNSIGDIVDLTYSQNPDGTLGADSISWTERYTTGTVTSVNANTMTLKDAITGQSEAFVPNDTTFNGIARGDVVSVTYYGLAGQFQADNISDYTACTNS